MTSSMTSFLTYMTSYTNFDDIFGFLGVTFLSANNTFMGSKTHRLGDISPPSAQWWPF